MVRLVLEHVSLEYPLYSVHARSLKSTLLRLSTGGVIQRQQRHLTAVKALDDISLTLTEGTRLGLIGHNGAGKSTLLKVMSHIYSPTVGHVMVEGQVAALLNLSLGMDDDATGYENVKILGLLMGMTHRDIKQCIPDIETFCELGDYLMMPVKTYSSGMRLRLAFAIATSVRPEILLLDEILGVGDARFVKKANQRLNQLIDQAKILVLASHDAAMIKQFCNQAILLAHGKIVAQGDVETVLAAYETEQTAA